MRNVGTVTVWRKRIEGVVLGLAAVVLVLFLGRTFPAGASTGGLTPDSSGNYGECNFLSYANFNHVECTYGIYAVGVVPVSITVDGPGNAPVTESVSASGGVLTVPLFNGEYSDATVTATYSDGATETYGVDFGAEGIPSETFISAVTGVPDTQSANVPVAVNAELRSKTNTYMGEAVQLVITVLMLTFGVYFLVKWVKRAVHVS